MRCLKLFTVLITFVLTACASVQKPVNQPPPHAAITSTTIDLTAAPDDLWERIRQGFAVPNINTELSEHWTRYFASHPQSVLLMTQRASKYLYHVVDELNARGLPTELALLPFVESAYNPQALSRSQAAGLWQFIPSTGRQYDLEQNWWQDQRRDPIASTAAALDYLAYLYEFQGDWHLALASYNWGEGAVKRAIEKNLQQDLGTDYLSLTLPEETRNYVPKLQAFKNLILDPKKYGLTLPAVSNMPYFTAVKKPQNIDIEVAAKLAEMPVEEFLELNPSHNRSVILAEHKSRLLLPTNRVARFQQNLTRYKGKLSAWTVHTRKEGETYASIAKQYGISIKQLKEVNGLGNSKTLANIFLVPDSPEVINLANTKEAAPTRRSSQPLVTHTIKTGDTLFALARRYKTTVTELRKLNNLKTNNLAAGKRIRVPGHGTQS